MEKLDALELAIQDAEYWATQLLNTSYSNASQKYMDQAEALQLLLAEIRGA